MSNSIVDSSNSFSSPDWRQHLQTQKVGDNSSGVASNPTEILAVQLLEDHPHFRGRSKWVHCRFFGGRLHLTGKLPSFYLKQIAQEVVRKIDGVDRIINQIQVASPGGHVVPGEATRIRNPR